MLKCRRGSFSLVFASIIGFLAVTGLAAFAAADAASLAQTKCTRCHSYAIVQAKKGASEKDWMMTIDKMKNAGLSITPEEQMAIAKYLAGQK